MNWNRAIFYQRTKSKKIMVTTRNLVEMMLHNFEKKHRAGELKNCQGFEIACSFYKKAPGRILKKLRE